MRARAFLVDANGRPDPSDRRLPSKLGSRVAACERLQSSGIPHQIEIRSIDIAHRLTSGQYARRALEEEEFQSIGKIPRFIEMTD